MKKRIISTLLCATMVASMVAGCGDVTVNAPGAADDAAPAAEAKAEAPAAEMPAAEAEAADEGKVLNIRCWNEEFKSRVTDHYPGYEKVDDTTGKIGDVTVNWIITPNDDNAYQTKLDEALLAQDAAAADDKVDIFLVEADYALKYVDTDYTLPVSEFGITDADTAEQFQYTKDIVTDSQGVLKGVSWQGCPAIMFYNRDIAAEVLGTEDPAEVQEFVKDWAAFDETAAKLKDAGYFATSSVMDTYRVYSNNVTTPWVVDGKLNIDENIMNWVNDSKALADAKETNIYDLWSDDWKKGFFKDVFAYFGPAWFINFSMAADQEGSVGANGRWGAVVGPQSFFWGGTWICGAAGTDNKALVGDIMRQLTCNADIMKEIVQADDDFANNVTAMNEMADSDYTSAILGGQNPLPLYIEGAKSIDLSNLSAYDQACNEEIQNAMKDYFGGKSSLDDAIALFKKAVKEKHPDVNVD